MDCHVHTNHSRCAHKEMGLKQIEGALRAAGISIASIVDHTYNNVDHGKYTDSMRKEIKKLDTPLKLFLSCEAEIQKGDKFNLKAKDENKFDYITASIHKLPDINASYKLSEVRNTVNDFKPRELMQEHMRVLHELVRKENVRMVGHLFRGPFMLNALGHDVFRHIKRKELNSLATEAKKNGVVFELSHMMFPNINRHLANKKAFTKSLNGYLKAIKILNRKGSFFCTGSDSHKLVHVGRLAWPKWIINKIGINHISFPLSDI